MDQDHPDEAWFPTAPRANPLGERSQQQRQALLTCQQALRTAPQQPVAPAQITAGVGSIAQWSALAASYYSLIVGLLS